MPEQATPSTLDPQAITAGLGVEVKEGAGYTRVLHDGKTVMYAKAGRVAVHTAHVKGAPKKLGSFTPEKSGPWSNAVVSDEAAARAILEHVLAAVAGAEDAS